MRAWVIWQKAEGGLVMGAGLAIWIAAGPPLPWWAAILVFFAPDLSFATYAMGPRVGAAAYNAVHLYGVWLVLIALGMLLAAPLAIGLGALWLAHAGFDRMLGYGLKSPVAFTDTHLGRIGRGG